MPGRSKRPDVLKCPSLSSVGYVLVVTVLAAVGFLGHNPVPIIAASALALPCSPALVAGYYLLYGLLAQIPGANPNTNSGSGTTLPDGSVVSTTVGEQATWFAVTTPILGILALTLAAYLNVVIVGSIRAGRASRQP